MSGYIVEWGEARARGILPLALAEGVKLVRGVRRGEAIRYADVRQRKAGMIDELRREMGDGGWEDVGNGAMLPKLEFPE